jgi:diguanylate cyclase (GGDEF)-like protein
LFSQAQILHLMKTEFARSRRHGLSLGCVLLQVDRMSQLIDLYGADLRTAVRETLGRLVLDRTRGSDMLGMVSDDRYLLMLPHTSLEETRLVSERLVELFQEYEVAIDGRALALTLSIGITASGEQQTMFFDTLVGQAESALEWALAAGGDRVASFGETQLLNGGGDDDGNA